ncbi:NADPH-dependent FMN reductase [Streptomyces sp. JJ38]|uniref:NADPH-dependent FMN reductase n=1 Tax=Streptomyces sp. JJ38 TaxID=2738128 RepID=UPI001C560117|nr:NAD(P)H-dependent oxidoreductase [Streptomyces sp. JJ38]MBW1598466.1 NAD(P)H-dependent oxidoreductase [Streptomyces sp. JJ38]
MLLLSGSSSAGSHTAATVEAAAGTLRDRGAEPLVWDLAVHPLPILDAARHGRPELHADPLARELPALADRADAFVLASPTYHGSFSGALKNALDHLQDAQVRGKPVGLVAHGFNLSATQVCDALRTVVRSLGGLAVPEQLVTVPADFERVAGHRTLTAPVAAERLTGLCEAVLGLAGRLAAVDADGVPAS